MNMGNSEQVFEGSVIWFRAAYGFLSWFKDGVQQKDLFVHFSDIVLDNPGYRTLRKGQQVSFQLGINNSGVPKAVNVRMVK